MARKRVVIVISGSGSNMETLVRDMMLPDHPAEPVLVVTNGPKAGGLERAHKLGLPVVVVDHRGRSRDDFEAELAKTLKLARPDLICLAGFMRILSPAFVAQFPDMMLNIHPSLLPKYPGLNTHARAIEAGDAEAGCSVHWVTADLDAGPILGQGRVPVKPGDTADTLAARVLEVEHRLYPAVLRRVAAGESGRLDL